MEPERRSESRFPLADQVVVTIKNAPSAPERNGQTLACHTADVSPTGLRLELTDPVDPGSVLSLWLKRLDGAGTLVLEGEVKWSSPAPGGHVHAGLHLAGPATDSLLEWQAMVHDFGNPRSD